MQVKSIAECSKGSIFCNTFDLHKAIIGFENQFSVFLRVAVLHRFNCTYNTLSHKILVLLTNTESHYLSKCGQLHSGAPCLNFDLSLHHLPYFMYRTIIEPQHEISNNVVYATSKASDQPAYMRSLIRAYASHLNVL